jgi:hypothetical protein
MEVCKGMLPKKSHFRGFLIVKNPSNKNSIKSKELDMASFNLIPYLFWKNEQNNFIKNVSHLTIGGSGTFTCELIKHFNIIKPKSTVPAFLTWKITDSYQKKI